MFFRPKKLTSYQGSKSNLLPSITTIGELNISAPPSNQHHGLVVDLSIVTRAIAAIFKEEKSTFDDFCIAVLRNIKHQAELFHVIRIDIVADMYDPLSIKTPTRETRGTAGADSFTGLTSIPSDMNEFMKNSENKTLLNALIATHALQPQSWDWDHEVVVTDGKTIKSSRDGEKDIFTWIQATHEESDNRMLIHIIDMLECGITDIAVRATDTDVIIILLSFMMQFQNQNEDVRITVDFGNGDSRRMINLNKSYENFENNYATTFALPFFHTFTGCDSTSFFYGKSKTAIFNCWMKCPFKDDLESAFQQLSWLPTLETVEQNFAVIERFIVYIYTNDDTAMSLETASYSIYK